ncbi:hypothetical protein ACJJTC_015642 [Scirpophaga incertulas]
MPQSVRSTYLLTAWASVEFRRFAAIEADGSSSSDNVFTPLFAIYLAATLITSEAPVSALAAPWAKTTTLRSSYDLSGEGSALLGIRHDAPKTYNIKGSPNPSLVKNERLSPSRTSPNFLEDRKSNRHNEITTSYQITSLKPNESTTSSNQYDNFKILTVSNSNTRTPYMYGFKTNTRDSNNRTGPLNDRTIIVNTSPLNEHIKSLRKRITPIAKFVSTTTEASNVITIQPTWKMYTNIERKPLSTMLLKSDQSSDRSEELEKSETVTIKVTLEDKNVKMTPGDYLQGDRQHKTQVTRDVANILLHSSPITEKVKSTVTESKKERDNITELASSTERTTAHTEERLSSKRAGFLDASVKRTVTEAANTSQYADRVTTTEKQSTITKTEMNEQNVTNKVYAITPPSQLVQGVIEKENNVNNSMKLTEDKYDTTLDDSFSVKPISPKGALYTVNPNYRKMKKIEVQSLRPFVRDPDDNSWRNESLSLLGIVFKAKNASKPFTQVLKNKTEAELNNLSDKDDKNEVSDLRERLEKIAEVRKSRKKKINKFGDTVYSDYEEATSSEVTNKPKINTVPQTVITTQGLAVASTSPSITTDHSTTPKSMRKNDSVTTKKPRKFNKFLEYYDTTDEYDADYILQPKIDLKKFTTRFEGRATASTPRSVLTTYATKSTNGYKFPERKPTVQYFPPLPPNQKATIKENTDFLQKKVNLVDIIPPMPQIQNVTLKENTDFFQKKMSILLPPSTGNQQVSVKENPTFFQKNVNLNDYVAEPVDIMRLSLSSRPTTTPQSRLAESGQPSYLDSAYYVTHPPRIAEPSNRHSAHHDEIYNRATYVINHFKHLMDEAAKNDDDKQDYLPSFTEPPLRGVTLNEAAKSHPAPVDEYDYAGNIRKDILNKFVDNFNQNSERFKVDFPILYNNSIVHRMAEDSGAVLASSTAFLKRLYETPPPNAYQLKACEPNCDMKVELSPEYELHYYVPEQEETEVLEAKQATVPYPYRYPIL